MGTFESLYEKTGEFVNESFGISQERTNEMERIGKEQVQLLIHPLDDGEILTSDRIHKTFLRILDLWQPVNEAEKVFGLLMLGRELERFHDYLNQTYQTA